MVRIIQAVYVIVDTQQAIAVQGFNQNTSRRGGGGRNLYCHAKLSLNHVFFIAGWIPYQTFT